LQVKLWRYSWVWVHMNRRLGCSGYVLEHIKLDGKFWIWVGKLHHLHIVSVIGERNINVGQSIPWIFFFKKEPWVSLITWRSSERGHRGYSEELINRSISLVQKNHNWQGIGNS
jgi:hypothetical protein